MTGDRHSRPSDDEVDYLLSSGSLGGSQRERIRAALEKPTAATAGRIPARRSRLMSLRRLTGVAAGAAAAVAVALWLRGSSPPDDSRFRSKGNAATAGAVSVDVTCLQGTLPACARGSLLAFATHGMPPGQNMFVTATLQRRGGAIRSSLLRNEPAGADAVVAGGLLPHGARIPDQQPPGDYTLEVLVTRRPLPSQDTATIDLHAPHAPPAPAAEDLVTRAHFDMTVPP